MKKVLFIDRDGTLIIEPPIDFQVDSLEKLEYYPFVFQYLSKIATELDYELVMVSNQDGLGTASFPLEKFQLVQNKIIQAFNNEGIIFSEILIDDSFPEENSPNRKPGIGMLKHYIKGQYNLKDSFVIGDRITDIELAKNLACGSIYMGLEKNTTANFSSTSWKEIYFYLRNLNRTTIIERKTNETSIFVKINLDGTGQSNIQTGLGFFDHMLEQIPKHGGMDLTVKVKGDLQVDEHHTIEDVAIVLGEAILKALGTKKGIERYGFLLPMDDCLAQVALDFGGRAWIEWEANFKRDKIGDMPTEMFFHFFKSLSDAAKMNLNIQAKGNNEHHKIEAIFKAFAKAMKMAVKKTGINGIPSTKGIL